LLEAEGEAYVDLTITMKRKDKEGEDVLPYVPPLRVFF
jgi:hypothetical protein